VTDEDRSLVERLRSHAWEDRQHRQLREAAAVEIERLRAMLAERNERLLKLYEVLTGQHRSTWPPAVESGT
jgi:hypothetical protein